jgi:hypothetical protein
MPEANVARFRNRLRSLRDRWRAGAVARAEVEAKVGAWIAHAGNADTWRLRQAVFRGGWFGEGRGGEVAPSIPHFRSACCAGIVDIGMIFARGRNAGLRFLFPR